MKFSLIGAAGYVAPRHMKAIRDLGHELVSVYDVHDDLAVLDQYFPGAACFSDLTAYTEFHRSRPLDYVSVCSPNHLHAEHIRWAMAQRAHVICEKPLVIEPAQLDQLAELEKLHGKKINTVLQLRNLESVQNLKAAVAGSNRLHEVDVRYVSARGNWYFNSWKGNEDFSGGLVTNIGIHLFDLLLWVFGPVREFEVSLYNQKQAKGTLTLEGARVNWFLSISAADLPDPNTRSFREMMVDDQLIRLDTGLEPLHHKCYMDIFAGKGTGIAEGRPSIELCKIIRTAGRNLLELA